MVNPIDIHRLTLEELSGVIALYPWYAGARMELCRRMSEMGALSESQIAETALHLGQRRLLVSLLHAGRTVDISDKDARRLLDAFLPEEAPAAPRRPIHVPGGDFFSQEEYREARSEGDGIFSKFAAKARQEGYSDERTEGAADPDFCTETLAAIYLEQGYPQQASEIYSRLSLRYPEKSVYFAALIEKINKKDN